MKDKVAPGDHDDDDDGDREEEEEEEGRGWGICAVLGLAPRLAPGICHLHIPRTFTPLFQIYLYCEFFSPVCASPMIYASAFPLILLNPMQINKGRVRIIKMEI